MMKQSLSDLLSYRSGYPCLGLGRSFFVAENKAAMFMDIQLEMDSAILEDNNVVP